MRRAVFATVVVAMLIAACGPKGLPKECDEYLAKYDCFLAVSGVTDRQTTISTMRDTWTTASKTAQGRSTIVTICLSQQAQMDDRFRTAKCNDVKAAAR